MLSVVVPVYNEYHTLGQILVAATASLSSVSKQIIVVDDCSTDGTREWLQANFRTDDGSVRPNCLEPGMGGAKPPAMRNPFRYFNSSPEVIRPTVMMYIRYPLSLRQVEDLLFERGIDICHETVRFWWNRFGPMFAAEIRKRQIQHRSYSNWRWHLDEVFVRINGETHHLWRAVDHEGEVLEVFATKRRDRKAALAFIKRAMKRYGRPQAIVTDRLRSYGAAMKDIGIVERQECGRWLNNRAENSHQPFRRREGAMARFRDIKTLQKLASVQASIHNHFNLDRHLNRRDIFKQNRSAALAEWRQRAA